MTGEDRQDAPTSAAMFGTEEEALAARLRRVRELSGETQSAFARRIGIKQRSWQDYETGNRVPGGLALSALARHGVNANWLLTGEGPVWAAGETSAPVDTPQIGEELLKACLVGLEEHLTMSGQTLPPDKKAELVIALAHMVLEQERESGHSAKPRGEWIARFVRLAS